LIFWLVMHTDDSMGGDNTAYQKDYDFNHSFFNNHLISYFLYI